MQIQRSQYPLSQYTPALRYNLSDESLLKIDPCLSGAIEEPRSLQGRRLVPMKIQEGIVSMPYGKQIRKLMNIPYTLGLRSFGYILVLLQDDNFFARQSPGIRAIITRPIL